MAPEPATRLIAWFALVLALALNATGFAASVEVLRSASDSALATVRRAVSQEDSEALASVFTDNGSIAVPTGQVIRGKTTIRSMAALMMMTWGGGNLSVTRDTLALKDSTGHEIGRFVFRHPIKDQPDQVWSGGYTVVWETEAGVWKISRISGLLSRPQPQSQKPDGK